MSIDASLHRTGRPEDHAAKSPDAAPLRVAIVHDWLTAMRGGERVVEALLRLYPDADLYTLTWAPEKLSPALRSRSVHTSFIDRLPALSPLGGSFRAFLPLFPRAIESFDLRGYDLVLSSSHCVAFGALVPSSAVHVSYVHSTMRYLREAQSLYEERVPFGAMGRAAFRAVARELRAWDDQAAQRPDVLLANSRYTRTRIGAHYGRDATVVEPPIDTERFARARARHGSDGGTRHLVVSALVPNKRVDLAVEAFRGRTEELIIVGDGPERARLEAMAGANVRFVGWVSDAELDRLYVTSRALVHPAIDDFGMAMAEALAAGIPVIAAHEGGALEIVEAGVTGLLAAPTPRGISEAVDQLARRTFDRATLTAAAARFDTASFDARLRAQVDAALAAHEGRRRRRVSSVAATPFDRRKRRADLLVSSAALAGSAPVLLTIALLVMWESGESPLFSHVRVGEGGRPFRLYKFRSLDRDGEATRVGRVIRPTGLDELPQLVNVLLGDMSLIGPRPELPPLVDRYEEDHPGYLQRHALRPGITGWAQVNGLRGRVSIADRLARDLEYIERRSLALDLRILAKTIRTVIDDARREIR